MGLKFDNTIGGCDWDANVVCDHGDSVGIVGDGGGNDGESSSSGPITKAIGSATAISVETTNSAGSAGANYADNEVMTGWHTVGSDWGGAWVDGKWYVIS